MIGWCVALKCLVARLFFELSQLRLSARAAESQLHPSVTQPQAIFAAFRARLIDAHKIQMATVHCHVSGLFLSTAR